MKRRFVAFAVLLLCGGSCVSADELHFIGFGDSMLECPFDNIEMQTEIRPCSAATYVNPSRSHWTWLQTLSAGQVDNAANKPAASYGRISGTNNYLEATPMLAYTFGGRFDVNGTDEDIKISDGSSFGFRLGYDYESHSQLEFLYSRQETRLTGDDMFPREALFDLDVSYFHIGGSLFWGRGSKVESYFAGTLGLTHMDPEDSAADSLTNFSMGFGGGVRYFPLERVGLYTGIRGLVTFVHSDTELRSSSGNTVILIDADTLWQFQVYAGLVLVF